jgi:lysophospholipase L1-like esterase
VVALAAAVAVPVLAPGGPAGARTRTAADPGRFVSLGDSVASGHGLDWSDWNRGDDCWRAGGDSPGGRFFSTWRRAGPGRSFTLLACSGATSADLLVPGGQVEQAVAVNPGLISITVGANDLAFVDPAKFFPGGRFDRAAVEARLQGLRGGLFRILSRLLSATDARILVTTYHDPTAADPVGVPGCRGACFATAARQTVVDLNATIAGVAGRFSAARVQVVDVAPRFVGHGAPNGWGPDQIREYGVPDWLPGWLEPPGEVVEALTAATTIQAYCSSVHNWGDDPNWVSGIDCVHPNEDGARAYAAAMVDAWRAAGWG